MALRKGWSRAPACFAVAAVLMLLIDMPGALADEQQPVIEINNGNLDIMLPETREVKSPDGGVAAAWCFVCLGHE